MTHDADQGDPALYARSFADVYAQWYDDLHDTAAIRRAVAERIGARSVIVELGSGSGHVAAPLVDDGHTVIALDRSAAMLRQDPSGSHRLVADMTHGALRSSIADLAIIAWNTLFNVTPISRQHEAIAESARVLRPGGHLVIEGFVAPPAEADIDALTGISVRTHPSVEDAKLVIATHQRGEMLNGLHLEVRADGILTRPWQLAYQSPAQIDASAVAAGLQLVERSADWLGTRFRPDDARHVSWYRAL